MTGPDNAWSSTTPRNLVFKISLAALACAVLGSAAIGGHLFQGQALGKSPTGTQAANGLAIQITDKATPTRPAGNGPNASDSGWPNDATPGTKPIAYPLAATNPHVTPGTGYDAPPSPLPPQPTNGRPGDDMAVPDGMKIVPSAEGHVYMTSLEADAGADRLNMQALNVLQPYFDNSMHVSNVQTNPQNYISRAYFTAAIDGIPVTGVVDAVVSGRGIAHIYLMFDDPRRVSETGAIMEQAAYRAEQMADEQVRQRPQ